MQRRAYIGQIRDGKLYLSGPKRQQMAADIARMKEGRLVEIEVKPVNRRSHPQNAYYWGVVVAMVQEALQNLGHEINAELTHELLKSKFNPITLCNADGEVIGEIGGTTSTLGKEDFSIYLERIKIFAATYLGITIPDPHSQTEIDFK